MPEEKKHFAVLGAGFAGLATAWYLHEMTGGSATVDLYDPRPIGTGASGLSSGLLHGFVGKRANKAWRLDKCLKAAHKLITESSIGAAGPIVRSHGVLRPALSEQQIVDFQARAQEFPEELQWWEAKKCRDKIPGLVVPDEGGGLFIPEGLTLNAPAYLQGLWQRCARLGTTYHQNPHIPLAELEKYTAVLVCMGPLTINFPGLQSLPIEPLKGQILELAWPRDVEPLPFSLVSKKYLTMGRDNKSCHVGATYERDFTSPNVEPQKAAEVIMPDIEAFFPALKGARILSARAGFRAATQSKLPLVGRLSETMFFFTGLGSKGLLFHAYIAKRVATAMIMKSADPLPRDLYYELPKQPEKGGPPAQS